MNPAHFDDPHVAANVKLATTISNTAIITSGTMEKLGGGAVTGRSETAVRSLGNAQMRGNGGNTGTGVTATWISQG